MEIWLIDRGSGERVYRLTLREVAALRALKAYRAGPTDKELYRKLFERAHDDRLRFQCCCRRVGSQYPDFYPRRHEKHEYLLVNRSGAEVTHAPDCVFRRGDAHALPPPRHPDVLGGFDAAGEERPPPDLDARPYAYWEPRPRAAAEQEKTLWGTASKLMQTARLNLLGPDERRPPPGEWLAAIATAADRLYLPPQGAGIRVPVHRSRRLARGRGGGQAQGGGAGLARGRTARRLSLLAGARGERSGGRPRTGRAMSRRPSRWSPVRRSARTRWRGRTCSSGRSPARRTGGRASTPVHGRSPRSTARSRSIRATSARRSARCGGWSGRWPATAELGALLGGAVGVELEKPLTIIETDRRRLPAGLPADRIPPGRVQPPARRPGRSAPLRAVRSARPGALRDRGHGVRRPGLRTEQETDSPQDGTPRAGVPHGGERVRAEPQGHRPPARGDHGRHRPRPAPALADGKSCARRRMNTLPNRRQHRTDRPAAQSRAAPRPCPAAEPPTAFRPGRAPGSLPPPRAWPPARRA